MQVPYLYRNIKLEGGEQDKSEIAAFNIIFLTK